MKSCTSPLIRAFGLIALGAALGTGGIYIGHTDDAPGAALLGLLLMTGLMICGVRLAWRTRQAGRKT